MDCIFVISQTKAANIPQWHIYTHPIESITEHAAKLEQTNNYQVKAEPRKKTVFTTWKNSWILPLTLIYICLYMPVFFNFRGGQLFCIKNTLTRQQARRVAQCTSSRVSGKLPSSEQDLLEGNRENDPQNHLPIDVVLKGGSGRPSAFIWGSKEESPLGVPMESRGMPCF